MSEARNCLDSWALRGWLTHRGAKSKLLIARQFKHASRCSRIGPGLSAMGILGEI
jgi:hypothetical protein